MPIFLEFKIQKFLLVTLLALFSIIFMAMPILEYNSLHLGYFDTGIFQNLLNNVIERGELGRAFVGHAHFIVFPYAGLLKLFPARFDAPILLCIQSLALMTPIPYLYKKHGLLVTFAYIMYAPLWLNNRSEFHFDHLVVPLMLAFFVLAEKKYFFYASIAALLLLTVKEPFALQTIGCGGYLLIQSIRLRGEVLYYRALVTGILLILIGSSYFYFATIHFIPYFTPGKTIGIKAEAFSWMGTTIEQVLWYVLSHPSSIIWNIVSTPDKLWYLFAIFGSLAFIPLLCPSFLIPALPLIVISMLSRVPEFYNFHQHYTVGLIVPIFFSFIHGLPKAKLVWNQYVGRTKGFDSLFAIYLLMGNIFFSSSPLSLLFWSNRVWTYNWHAYISSPRDNLIKQALTTYIPNNRSVSVVVQNNINWHTLAHHDIYMPFPMGIEEPIELIDWSKMTLQGFWHHMANSNETINAIKYLRFADFVVIDLHRPWTINDKSCRWYYGRCQDKQVADTFLRWVDKAKQRYRTIFEYDGFSILERKNLIVSSLSQ